MESRVLPYVLMVPTTLIAALFIFIFKIFYFYKFFIKKHLTIFFLLFCCFLFYALDRKFRMKSHLKDHLETHSSTCQIQCGDCGKMLKTSTSLRIHRHQVHSKTKKFKCEICDRIFSRKFTRDLHVRKKHYGKEVQSTALK